MSNKTNSKILIISLGYLPTFGGSYRVLHELNKRVYGKEILVLTSKNSNSKKFDNTINYKIHRSIFISLLVEDGVIFGVTTTKKLYSILYFYAIKKIFKYFLFPLLSFFYIIYFIKKQKIKNIIFAQSVIPIAWYIIIMKRLFDLKIITFVYGEDIVSYRKKNRIYKYLKKIFLYGLRKVDIIITNSGVTTKECLLDGIDINKIHTIYPAVDYDFFKPVDKISSKKFWGIEDQFLILSVGRLIRRKGFDRILDILPDICKKIPNVQYIICGEGYDKEYLVSKIITNKLTNYVKILEGVSYELLPSLYSASDIFVLTNRLDEKDNEQEGFGIVFLEANACGIPVIGGNSGGVIEVIEDGINGFLVDPNNNDEIYCKILEIYYSKNKYYQKNIREFIMNKYNWNISAKKFNEILNNLF